MADAGTTPRIEELRARLKADPKSRLFYPLAEELRKVKQLPEAERVLREGLAVHTTYLSAWISLGRVLKDAGKHAEAIEVLEKALGIDAGNVVSARLLADTYLLVGDRVEALKKFKLVRALLPADEEVSETIQRLEDEIANAQTDRFSAPPESEVSPDDVAAGGPEAAPADLEPPVSEDQGTPLEVIESTPATPEAMTSDERDQEPGQGFEASESEVFQASDQQTAAVEEPWGTERAEIEGADPVESAQEPRPAEVPPIESEERAELPDWLPPKGDYSATEGSGSSIATEEESPFEAREPDREDRAEGDHLEAGVAATATLAQIYAEQGHTERAREVYEQMLAREPENLEYRRRIEELSGRESAPAGGAGRQAVIERLEGWLTRVGRKGAGGV
ncbi:MAG TPA: tetratricopeptide repeat protein [Thermoanaerobaculia bacterium]|nr:tetratricopeptide repeat protein [Thermoanaerobaculia bacterium]